jgi:PilZ domain
LPPPKNQAMAATTEPDRQHGRDRRRWSRYDVAGLVPAVLVTEDRQIACRIENVSLTGARLRVAEPAPPSSQLRLDYEQASGPSGRCVWRTQDSIGVSFGFCEDSVALAMACIRLTAPETEAPSQPEA